MAIDPEFGRRLRTAKREWETRHDRELPNSELAALVAQRAGVDSLSGQAVGYWLNKGQEPSSLALLRALAEVLEVPLARLAGEEPLGSVNPAAAMGYVPRPLPPDRIEKETRDRQPTKGRKRRSS